jgi:hypothetical protein
VPIERRIQACDPTGDMAAGRAVIKAQRGDGKHHQSAVVDQKGVFIGAVAAAAIFDDAQPARADLLGDSMIERDDAIGDVFLDAVARELAIRPALCRHDRRDLALLQPAEQPSQLGAQDAVVF